MRIEARTAGDEVAHAIAEGAVQLAEKDAASVESNSAQAAIQRHQSLQRPPRHCAALGYLLEDALVNQVEKLRHHGKNRDLAFVERAQQFGGIQRFQIDDSGSFHQRQQEIGHLGEHVKERQHPKHGILRTDVRPSEYRFNFAQQIGVGEHHALGVGSCAGGVEQGSDNVRGDGGRFEAARARGKDAVKIGHRWLGRIGIAFFCSAGLMSTVLMGNEPIASRAVARCLTSQNSNELPLSFSRVVIWSACKAVSSGTAVHPDATTPRKTATQRG